MSYCQNIAQQYDNDRYLCCLFTPEQEREALFTLLAFNHEIAKTAASVTEEMLGLIRLTWWREAIEEIYAGAAPRAHEVIAPLAHTIQKYHLTKDYFLRIISAREADLQCAPFQHMLALEEYAEETSSTLLLLWLEVLGAKDEVMLHVAHHLGMAWSLLGILRSLPHMLHNGCCMLPDDVLAAYQLNAEVLLQAKDMPPISVVIAEIHNHAQRHLDALKKYPPEMRHGVLPLILLRTAALHYSRKLRWLKFEVMHGRMETGRTMLHLKLLMRGMIA